MTKQKVSLRIPENLLDEVKEIAKNKEINLSQAIIELVQNGLMKKEVKVPAPAHYSSSKMTKHDRTPTFLGLVLLLFIFFSITLWKSMK